MITQRVGGCLVVAEFGLGERVFYRMAGERQPGLVTAIEVRPGLMLYHVSWGDRFETRHYAIELSREYEPDFGEG